MKCFTFDLGLPFQNSNFLLRTRIFKSRFFPFTIHHCSIHSFAIEMFKVNMKTTATIIDDILTISYLSYNLRPKPNSVVPTVRKRSKQSSVQYYCEYDTVLDKRF